MLERLVPRAAGGDARGFLRYACCLPVVLLGWVLFRADTLAEALGHWSAMLWPFEPVSFALSERTPSRHTAAALAVGAVIFFLPGEMSFGRRLAEFSTRRWHRPGLPLVFAFARRWCWPANSPFLYFRF